MELDLTGIHKLAAEQGIDPGTLDDALAEALRLAYLKTPHAARHARVELDERSGNFTVWAADEIPVEPTEDDPHPAPKLGEEYDDTPRDFGRLAAATARQVITQLFRRAEDEKVFGAFSGQKGKLITGIIQQDASDPSNVHVAMGDVEAILPRREQVPGERYRHGDRHRRAFRRRAGALCRRGYCGSNHEPPHHGQRIVFRTARPYRSHSGVYPPRRRVPGGRPDIVQHRVQETARHRRLHRRRGIRFPHQYRRTVGALP